MPALTAPFELIPLVDDRITGASALAGQRRIELSEEALEIRQQAIGTGRVRNSSEDCCVISQSRLWRRMLIGPMMPLRSWPGPKRVRFPTPINPSYRIKLNHLFLFTCTM